MRQISRPVAWITHLLPIGTYEIFRQMRQHWVTMTHPVYRADLRRTAVGRLKLNPTTATTASGTRLHNWILTVLIFAVIALLVPNLLTAIPGIVISGLGFILFGVTWIGYVQYARQTSRIIVEERDKQTWESLLTTPMAWEDLILAKMAAALHSFSLSILFLLFQAAFLVGLFAIVIYQEAIRYSLASNAYLGYLLEFVLNSIPFMVLTLIGFTVGRLQDIVLLSVIGAIVSLLSPNRQIATVGGVFAGIGYVLGNAFLIVLSLSWIANSPQFFRGELLAGLAATGPTGSLLVGLPIPGAILAVAAIILVREILIRTLFGWLTRHLAGG